MSTRGYSYPNTLLADRTPTEHPPPTTEQKETRRREGQALGRMADGRLAIGPGNVI